MRILGWIALLLVVVGGLNWGLVGIFDYNLVDTIFGAGSTAARTIYGVVGFGALYMIFYELFAASPVPSFRGRHLAQH